MKYQIDIIKGDTFDCLVTIKSGETTLTDEDIEHLYFSSEALNVTKELEYDSEEEAFELTFDSDETSDFKDGIHSYDLTMYTVGATTSTCIYENIVHIHPKNNEVNADE